MSSSGNSEHCALAVRLSSLQVSTVDTLAILKLWSGFEEFKEFSVVISRKILISDLANVVGTR